MGFLFPRPPLAKAIGDELEVLSRVNEVINLLIIIIFVTSSWIFLNSTPMLVVFLLVIFIYYLPFLF